MRVRWIKLLLPKSESSFFALPWHKFKVSDIIRTPAHNIVRCNLVWFSDPSCMGRAKREGKGLVNNSTPTWIHNCIPASSVDEEKKTTNVKKVWVMNKILCKYVVWTCDCTFKCNTINLWGFAAFLLVIIHEILCIHVEVELFTRHFPSPLLPCPYKGLATKLLYTGVRYEQCFSSLALCINMYRVWSYS